VRSQSIQGLSVIDITFREGSDPYRARQQVSEALADAAAAARRRRSPHHPADLLHHGPAQDRAGQRPPAHATARSGRMDDAPRLLAAHGVARANVLGANNAASRCASGPRRCWRAG
jgi:multidrug efflux pump subunit AcrB